MDIADRDAFMQEVYRLVLGRDMNVNAPEYGYWAGQITQGMTPADFIQAVSRSKEAIAKRGAKTFFPPGHASSSVVDPATVGPYVQRQRSLGADCLNGIQVSISDMRRLARGWRSLAGDVVVRAEADPSARFSLDRSTQFPFGDAWALKTVIKTMRPKRIIEVGAGAITGCILDTLDEFSLTSCQLTSIGSPAAELAKHLRDGDAERMTVITDPVQDVPLQRFSELQAGDILFLDTTHVLKTGSDLHHILFHVLPALSNGVWIQFHDCMYPFEYPDFWIKNRNYSWNEIYAIRAFLTNNTRFRVRYWMSMIHALHPEDLEETHPDLRASPGSGIWLEKVEPEAEPKRSSRGSR